MPDFCKSPLVYLAVQAMEARIAIAGALARQWFGMVLRPLSHQHAWLTEGLAGHLQDNFIRRFFGRNELRYRCPQYVACALHVFMQQRIHCIQCIPRACKRTPVLACGGSCQLPAGQLCVAFGTGDQRLTVQLITRCCRFAMVSWLVLCLVICCAQQFLPVTAAAVDRSL